MSSAAIRQPHDGHDDTWPLRTAQQPADDATPLQSLRDHGHQRTIKDTQHNPKVPAVHVQQRRRPAPWIERLWFWELGACVLGIACLASIVGVLIYEDGKPLDEWRLIIAPTAVVSFLGTLTKSSMLLALSEVLSQSKWLHFQKGPQTLSDLQLFDAASRGPWGSATFLFQKHKGAALASVAALIVMISILVDPFVQLVFSFPSRMVPASSAAPSLLTTKVFDAGLEGYLSGLAGQVSPELQASILQGLYDEPYNRQASCPTGNCEWQNVETLGVCASCSNVTSEIRTKSVSGTSADGPGTRYTFPTNSYLDPIEMYSPSYFLVGKTPRYTAWNSSAGLLDDVDIVSIGAVQRLVTGKDADGFPILSPATCWMCSFSFCSKQYASIKVINGTLAMPEPVEGEVFVSGNLTEKMRSGEDATAYISLIKMKAKSSGSDSDAVEYTVNEADGSNLGSYLSELFTAAWSTTNEFWRPSYGMTQYPYVSPNIARSLGESTDLNATVKAIAESLTQTMRTNRNSTQTTGQSFVERTYIRVQWGWLVLPIALTALTCGILLITILRTQRRGLVAWKSSGLALLFYHLEGIIVPQMTYDNRSELDRTATRMKVQLLDDFDDHAFVSTTDAATKEDGSRNR